MRRITYTLSGILILGTAIGHALTSSQENRLKNFSHWLGKQDIDYRERWRPPGYSEPWLMDCSNTARYIFKEGLGVDIPRTASSQYWVLDKEDRVTAAPRNSRGVNTERLVRMLKPGDLLFWEWTYAIKRRPPVSHVMVYLGKNSKGQPLMVGSSSARRRSGIYSGGGGVDIYTFNPNASMGGVKNSRGQYIHRGKFVGFGRVNISANARGKNWNVSASTRSSDSGFSSSTSKLRKTSLSSKWGR